MACAMISVAELAWPSLIQLSALRRADEAGLGSWSGPGTAACLSPLAARLRPSCRLRAHRLEASIRSIHDVKQRNRDGVLALAANLRALGHALIELGACTNPALGQLAAAQHRLSMGPTMYGSAVP